MLPNLFRMRVARRAALVAGIAALLVTVRGEAQQSSQPGAAVEGAPRPALPDTADITPEMIEKGRKLYHGKGLCFSCHGMKLEGTPIAPAHRKTSGWKDAKDGAFPELVRVITSGVPGTVMVANPNGISGGDGVLLASYIWAVNNRGVKP